MSARRYTKRFLSLVAILSLAMFVTATSAFAEPWSFGVMSDTQWIGTDDGKNPNTVAVDIINQLNQQFITFLPELKFVIQVGDLVDNQSITGCPTCSLYTTAIFRQALYDHGIGFFPLRGNHESNKASAATFRTVFPQTQDGVMNNTPDVAYSVSNPDALMQPSPVKTGGTFTLGTNFSSPATSLAGDLKGLSYAFDHDNARFVLLDQFTPADSASSNLNPAPNTIDNQQPWISSVLSGKPADSHAFVFSHKGLVTQNHVDNLFGSSPAFDPTGMDNFIMSLASNGVRYYAGGHDHMYNQAVVTTTDGHTAKVHELVLASDSSKFYVPFGTAGFAVRTVSGTTVTTSYTPGLPAADPTQTNDYIYNVLVGGGITRETPIAQELFKVGFYIVTVDGPKVTVDYYSADNTGAVYDATAHESFIIATPSLVFTKKEAFGYSLNGQEFLVGQGQSYTSVQDTFNETTAKILAGTNGSTATDSAGRAFTKAVNTGWTPGSEADDMDCSSHHKWPWFFKKWHKAKNTEMPASDILTLWGMADLGSDQTDTYALSMSYDHHRLLPFQFGKGLLGLATPDEDGDWVNAVDMNFGGTKKFVLGPWKPGYGLGTYGIDLKTHTAWAVINYNADFAVAGFRHY